MMKPAAVGIDVGGTKTLCVLVDKHFRELARAKFKTVAEEGRDRFTRDLTLAVESLSRTARERGFEIVGVGIGCAGTVDENELRIKISPNLMALENYPIGKYLRKVVKAKITIGNDVQVGIHAEHQLGAAKGCSPVLGVFFGTGVGGAAIINKRIYTGACGFGGQVGSLVAQPVGGPEAALSHGIIDRIASKSAIARANTVRPRGACSRLDANNSTIVRASAEYFCCPVSFASLSKLRALTLLPAGSTPS